MTRAVRVISASVGFLLTASLTTAQTPRSNAFRREISAGGVVMLPRGDFQRALQTRGSGAGFHGLVSRGSSPLSIGVDGQVLFYSFHRELATDQTIVTAHALLRLRRREGVLRPYAETVAGLKGFSTDDRFPTSSYGIGAGMQIPLARRRGVGPWERELLEIGIRYLEGGEAHVDYGKSASRTRSVMFHVGMALQF